MVELKRIFSVILSLLILTGMGWGVNLALHSPLFTLQDLEIIHVGESPSLTSLDDEAVKHLAQIPVGKVSLFNLDLKAIEGRLLAHEWIRNVRFQKKYFHGLVVSIIYREPQALIQIGKGALAYVDVDGKIFGAASLSPPRDLPLLSGFATLPPSKIKGALKLLDQWERSAVGRHSEVSSLSWEAGRGYRALVSYSLGKTLPSNLKARTMVDLGKESEQELLDSEKWNRLSKVFKYLSRNSIASRQIWADNGKKIVVKTARGS